MSKELKCILEKLQNQIDILTANVSGLNNTVYNLNKRIEKLENSIYNIGFTTQSNTSFVKVNGAVEIGPHSVFIENNKITYGKSDVNVPSQEHIGTIYLKKEVGVVPVVLDGISGGSYTIYVSSIDNPNKSVCSINVLNTGLKRTLVNNYVEDSEQSNYISGIWVGSNVALVRSDGSYMYNIVIDGVMTHVTDVPFSNDIFIGFEPNEYGSWYVLGRISNSGNVAPTTQPNAYIQNGWSGGADEYWTNDSTGNEQIVDASTPTYGTTPFSGTQCWFAKNLYGFTTGGQFSPKLLFQSEFPMTTDGETAFNEVLRGKTIETIFYFKTFVNTNDGSLFKVYNGAFLGNDRTGFNINIQNNSVLGCDVFTYSYDVGTGTFPTTNLATNLPYQTWHKIKITTTYAADGDPNNDVFLYSINDGPDQNVMSWMNIWRLANSFDLSYGTWIMFNDTGGTTSPSSGFYIDNISILLVE
jgi:hypothetical protein